MSGPPISTGGAAPPPRRRPPAPGPAGSGPPAPAPPTPASPTPTPPGRPSPAVIADPAATAPPTGSGRAGARRRGRGRGAGTAPAAPAKYRGAPWWLRLVAWIVSVPLGLVLVGVPARKLGYLSSQKLLDIVVGNDLGRYVPLAVIVVLWALVTALLVQAVVEIGGVVRRRRDRRVAVA